jgi:hypothetical protein
MNAKHIVNRLLEIYSGPQPESQPEPEPKDPTDPLAGSTSMNLGTIFAALPPGIEEQVIAVINHENDAIAMAYVLVHLAQQQRGIQ